MTVTAIVLIAVTKRSTFVMTARVPRNVVKMVRLASNAQCNFVVLSEMAADMADMADMGATPFHTDDCYWISIHMVIREERSPQKLRLEPDPCLMEILMPV